ncbi:hypothetical protein ORJ00_06800 [Rheinheimera baltica]|uniref:hypothetical protein n=1 Tax=Rheinheimera baltica TaxID=67576 RepID=UPI00273E02C7|nr:hypothetical protein [Rheinheimera baltica]MDP5142444.1 hypothetical protein [Rheinheimera baltica]
MVKRRRELTPSWLYRRVGTDTVYARDRAGRYLCYRLNGQQVRQTGTGITSLGPIYGRVDFSNSRRFTGRTRNQGALAVAYNTSVHRISSGWTPLPQTRPTSRRQTNQGMSPCMLALTGTARSATSYAIWYDGNHPQRGIKTTLQWEWCHLLAHSMAGADNQTNIVAAVKGNNSEQLAIESALQMYRCENMFEMNISAACIDNLHGRHLGNVIKYEIRCRHGGNNYVQYLDCLNAPRPSAIHYYNILESVALWANRKLEAVSNQMHNNSVSASERRLVLNYINDDV